MLKINRRGFLKKSAAAGTLALAGGATSKTHRLPLAVTTPRRGANEELRVAVVGFRGMGGGHIGAHTRPPKVRVVTLCDIDENLFEGKAKFVEEKSGRRPKTETDVRRVIDDQDVDCVSTATPNHWHALITVWACQAGKDVYVQKPCSHNIFEGRQMVEAAKKYKRIVQVGTQSRSSSALLEATKLLREGLLGEIYMSRGLCFKRRGSIGMCADGIGSGKEHQYILHGKKGTNYDQNYMNKVQYDLWIGPAQKQPFNYNRFHYNWHWNWDFGNGDIGNQGVHEMDIAQWALGKDHNLPVEAHSMGGRYTYQDQGQTPNTQVSTFKYADGKMLVFEVRGRQTNKEEGARVGNLIYGSKGYMVIHGYSSFKTFIDGKPGPSRKGGGDHFENFHRAVRKGDPSVLNAPIEFGHRSAALCHMANISYRLGRSLKFDPQTETFTNDSEANRMMTRNYRKPFVVPQKV
ncbi:MAG: Gfo/Idh/MocA family protein [Planctomycetota bacterium]